MSGNPLLDAIAVLAPEVGRNDTAWSRLSTFRFDAPQDPEFGRVDSLSLCVVLSGRKAVHIGERRWHYDPMSYLVLTRETEFDAEILQASTDRPFYSFILQIEPALVRRVAADMAERTLTVLRRPLSTGADPARPAFVSAFDSDMAGVVLRFLHSAGSEADRRVLSPLCLHEIVYRLLQADQRDRLLDAAQDEDTDPIAAAATYMRNNLARPLTVADIAGKIGMGESAFAHLFKEITGTSPYQFLQQARLERARTLLVAGELSVGEIAKSIGYGSLSHFSNEFRRRFGVSPRGYVQLHNTSRPSDGGGLRQNG